MYSGPHIIFLRKKNALANFCLGVKPVGEVGTLEVQNFDKSRYDQAWQLIPVPTNFDDTAYFLMHIKTGLCANFRLSNEVSLSELDPRAKSFLIRLEVYQDGFVCIADHDRHSTMNAKGDDIKVGTPIIPWGLAKADNDLWIFVSTSIYGMRP